MNHVYTHIDTYYVYNVCIYFMRQWKWSRIKWKQLVNLGKGHRRTSYTNLQLFMRLYEISKQTVAKKRQENY